MSRLVFLFNEGGSASTDVLLPKEDPTNHKLAIQRAMADLLPRTARGFPYKTVSRVVYKQYDADYRTAFRDHPVEVDVMAINDRLAQLREESHAAPAQSREPRPVRVPKEAAPADPEPDDPEGDARGDPG